MNQLPLPAYYNNNLITTSEYVKKLDTFLKPLPLNYFIIYNVLYVIPKKILVMHSVFACAEVTKKYMANEKKQENNSRKE